MKKKLSVGDLYQYTGAISINSINGDKNLLFLILEIDRKQTSYRVKMWFPKIGKIIYHAYFSDEIPKLFKFIS